MSSNKKLALHWKIIIGLMLGVLWALLSAQFGWSEFTRNWIKPWGDIFINILKMIALPLVFLSIVLGVSSLTDISKLGRIGGKTLGAYLVTTILSVTIGLLLVNIINPGALGKKEQLEVNRMSYELWVQSEDGIDFRKNDDLRLSEDPAYTHLKEDAAKKMEDDLTKSKKETEGKEDVIEGQKKAPPLQPLVDVFPNNFLGAFSTGKMLQIIFIAIFFGICLALINPGKAQPVVAVIDGLNDVFIAMVNVVMMGAPFFVFALLAGQIDKMTGDDPAGVIDMFKTLGWYSLTVLIGLALMIFVIYPLIVTIFVKKLNYKKFFRGIKEAQITAFSTSSSAATLPITLKCVNKGLGVSKRISDFVLPIGATVNMDGTSLYQAVAVIFLAQFHMIDLDLVTQLTIVGTATLASIGSAAVPSAGLIMLIMILESVGLNPAWIAIIFPVDRILDMCRTVVNVTGDATVSSLIAQSEGELKET